MIRTKEISATEKTPTAAPLRIAIQGYRGAFHEIAARNFHRDQEIEIVPADTFDELVEIVEKGERANGGMMAIENSLAGSIMHNYRLLNESNLSVFGEVFLRIKQNLMALPGKRIEDLKEVRSHPMAIAQCREFFRSYPHIRLIETLDTALSAKRIQEQNLQQVGAIASTLAAELYELEVLMPSIETNKKNYTRFLVLGRKNGAPQIDEVEKVSLCFSAGHEVGSLHKVLAVLAAYNINLTKIQSAPIIGRQWEYRFFVDFVMEGKVGWAQALEAIKPLTTELKVHGTYRKGVHYEL